MGKDPAFLFYPNDYIGGTMGMTFEEKGAYVDLLMMQFNRGHMTTDMIGHVLGHTFGLIWDKLKSKFAIDDNGLYYNIRLEIEVKKRQEYCVSRIKNKEGINQYSNRDRSCDQTHDQDMTSHMSGHMEDENVNINDNSKDGVVRGRKFIKPRVEEVQSYCLERKNGIDAQSFINFYESKGWLIGKNKMKDWKAAVRTWEQNRKQTSGKPSSPIGNFEQRQYTQEQFDSMFEKVDGGE